MIHDYGAYRTSGYSRYHEPWYPYHPSDDHFGASSSDSKRASSRQRRKSTSSATHGSYIYDFDTLDGERYDALDPTACDCLCCPHPVRRADTPLQGPVPWQRYRDDEGCRSGRRSSVRNRSPARDPRTGGRLFDAKGRRRDVSDGDGIYRASSSRRAARQHSRHPASEAQRDRRHSGNIVIDVVDHTDNQYLRRRYGRRFPITIDPTSTSAHDIARFLAPDFRREKVVVRWHDGEIEPLDDLIPLHELSRPGPRLEVRMHKSVHWTR